MFEIITILIAITTVFNLLLIISYFRIKIIDQSNYNDFNISIIIPFKNEERKLPNLLKSLSSIDYPASKFEIILVNDNSTDNSENIIKTYTFSNVRIINALTKNISGKKGALEIGINHSNYDIIVITDADCIVEKNWLKSISQKISEGYDLVFGYSPLIKDKSLIAKISSYENLKNYILYILLTQLRVPFGATARNFAFKKSVYNAVSGYSNTTETLSGDDDLFIRECLKKNFKIGFFLNKDSYVYSYPSVSFKEYFKRKSRHTKTSHYYLTKHKIILGLWYSTNTFATLTIFLLPFSIYYSIPFLIKVVFDLVLVFRIKRIMYHDFNIIEIIYLELIYQFFIPINFLNSLLLKDEWNKPK